MVQDGRARELVWFASSGACRNLSTSVPTWPNKSIVNPARPSESQRRDSDNETRGASCQGGSTVDQTTAPVQPPRRSCYMCGTLATIRVHLHFGRCCFVQFRPGPRGTPKICRRRRPPIPQISWNCYRKSLVLEIGTGTSSASSRCPKHTRCCRLVRPTHIFKRTHIHVFSFSSCDGAIPWSARILGRK